MSKRITVPTETGADAGCSYALREPFSGCIGMVGRSAYVQTVSFRGCFKKINGSAARRGCQRGHENVNIGCYFLFSISLRLFSIFAMK